MKLRLENIYVPFELWYCEYYFTVTYVDNGYRYVPSKYNLGIRFKYNNYCDCKRFPLRRFKIVRWGFNMFSEDCEFSSIYRSRSHMHVTWKLKSQLHVPAGIVTLFLNWVFQGTITDRQPFSRRATCYFNFIILIPLRLQASNCGIPCQSQSCELNLLNLSEFRSKTLLWPLFPFIYFIFSVVVIYI